MLHWFSWCFALVLCLAPRIAFASAPMCDWTASSVNAPLPAPPSADGEIRDCDFDLREFDQHRDSGPEDLPRRLSAPQPRDFAVWEPELSTVSISFSDWLIPLPPLPDKVDCARPEHRSAIERPPRAASHA